MVGPEHSQAIHGSAVGPEQKALSLSLSLPLPLSPSLSLPSPSSFPFSFFLFSLFPFLSSFLRLLMRQT